MPDSRRDFIKKSMIASLYSYFGSIGLLIPQIAEAKWPANIFTENKLQVTLDKLFGKHELIESKKIRIRLPRTAENGAFVPISITSSLKNVESIFILAEKNPVPLVARFDLTSAMKTFVSARFKMAETCDVIVIAKSSDSYFSTRKKVKVTLGGCGG